MPGDDSPEEEDFAQLMVEAGVQSYGGAPPRPSPRPPAAGSASDRVDSRPSPPAPPASPAPAPPVDPRLAVLDELEDRVARTAARVEELEAALAARDTELQQVKVERSAMSRERHGLKERLQHLEAQTAPERLPSLPQLLVERGCDGEAEMARALEGLLGARSAELLAALEALPGEARATRVLLNDRLFLLCGGPDCGVDSPGFTLDVPARRCDVCAGSPIQAAFVRFVETVLARGFQRVLLVGGSPAYRKTLKELAQRRGEGLELDLVAGTGRRTLRQAEADLRRSDLVVLWGGTILDHSVSELYRSGDTPIVRVSERGITRMLGEVRRELSSS